MATVPTKRIRRTAFAVAASLGVVVACSNAVKPAGPDSAARQKEPHVANFAPALFAVAAQFTTKAWEVKEYHDVQALQDIATNSFGPVAELYASPYLSGFTDVKQVSAHRDQSLLVAIVNVAAGNRPQSYDDLYLREGINCVFLKNTEKDDSDGRWTGYVTERVAGECRRPGSSDRPLKVSSIRGAYNDHHAFPGAARFGESRDGQPLIGVRCLNRWCEIGPLGFVPRSPAVPQGTGSDDRRERKIKGWHDEQLLPVMVGNSAQPLLRGMVTPEGDLHTRDTSDYRTFRGVAEVWLDPSGPVGATYGALPRGRHRLELRYDGNDRWSAQVAALTSGGSVILPYRPLTVTSHRHLDVPIPGTARFHWAVGNQVGSASRRIVAGVWIPCDQGCCDVDM